MADNHILEHYSNLTIILLGLFLHEEDLKFRIKRAVFDITDLGTVTLENDAVPSKRLKPNPLTFTHGDTALKVIHKDNGMYNTANNVTISGVSSGLSTTLSAAITSTATTLTLTSGTNFNKTTGKFANTADTTPRFYIKIDDEIMYYETISGAAVSTLVRAQESTTAAAHSSGATVEFFQLHKVPLSEVNKTHTAIANTDLDSYSILLTSSPVFDGGAGSSAENGGSVVLASENHIINTGFYTDRYIRTRKNHSFSYCPANNWNKCFWIRNFIY